MTNKNYDKLASAETKAAVEAAQNAILNGEVVVDSALTNQELAVELRDSCPSVSLFCTSEQSELSRGS